MNKKLAIALSGVAALLVAVQPAAAKAPRGSRANPYPVRTTIVLPEGKAWTLRVNGSIPNGTRFVLSKKSNFPPPDGEQYFVINLTMTHRGKGIGSPLSAYDLSAVGRSGLTYTRLNDDCGNVPKALDDFKRVASGRNVTGNICFSVRQVDARGLVLKCVPTASRRTKVFFRLH
jgi:hypothetical protein